MQVAYKEPTTEKKSSTPRAEELISRYNQLKGERSNFEGHWQTLHDYFYIEAADINKTYSPGAELDSSYLWDATTLESADVFASGFMNYLTPPTSKWSRLRHRDPKLADNKAVGNFLAEVNEEVMYTYNRSNFYDQMFPAYKSSGVLGTSLLFQEEDVEDEVRFSNMPLNQVCLWEDARGRIIGYFIEFEYTPEQAASRWGVEALSTEMQEQIKNKAPAKKEKFLLFIAKRHIREVQKTDKKNLPIEACWIDVKAKSIIEESGYHELPAMCHRFDKRPNIPWGFSPAMKSLPFARLLNTIAKTNLRSMMKLTDPPIAIPDNAFLAPFNMNPRAVNVYRKDTMTDGKGIFPFGNYGNPNVGMECIEFYQGKVKSLMYNDVFLKFQGITKEMNNPEFMEMLNEKMTMLGPAVGRWLSEILSPNIQRTIGILQRRGKLPPLPDEMMDDPNYEIDFVGVLAQSQRRAELNTLNTGLQLAAGMAQYNPEILDKISGDKVIDEVWAITGAPVKVLRDDAEIKDIREHRAQQALEAQQMAMASAGADVAKNAGSATKSFSEASKDK